MKWQLKSLLLASMLLTALALTLSTYRVSAYRQQVPLVTLQSSESIAGDAVSIALASNPAKDDQMLYVLRSNTGGIAIYDRGRTLSGNIDLTMQSTGVMAVNAFGNVYLAFSKADLSNSPSEVVTLNSKGQFLGRFSTPAPTSLAVQNNGSIVVAAPDKGKLFHLYNSAGKPLGSFGQMKSFDSNAEQNRYLNSGKVIVGPSDEIYYVFQYAAMPTVQKFSRKGEFLSEFAVEGAAIDIQLEMARRVSRHKSSETVGGVTIINSAAVDPATGHLWIGMNGSSKSGVVYEYDVSGAKLREYSLMLNSPASSSSFVTDVQDIAVKSPTVYIQTIGGGVYRFDLSNGYAARQSKGQPTLLNHLDSIIYTAWTPATETPIVPQASCPPTQTWPACSANCPGGSTPPSVNCKEELQNALGSNPNVVGSSCGIFVPGQGTPPFPNGGCNATVTTCNVTSGAQVTSSTRLTCNAAPPPPPRVGFCNGAPDWGTYPSGCASGFSLSGGVCTRSSSFISACSRFGDYDSDLCECTGDPGESPILIDVSGNDFALTNAQNGINFDLNGNGTAERIAWTAIGSDNAWLVLDRNGNGIIDNGSELFGNFTPQPPPAAARIGRNGFTALAEYDKVEKGGNGDGVIDNRDAIFSQLRLWQDTNHNGISEAWELHTLPELGVDSIALDYKESKRTDQYGNRFRYRAKVDDARHSHVGRWAWDVFLTKAP